MNRLAVTACLAVLLAGLLTMAYLHNATPTPIPPPRPVPTWRQPVPPPPAPPVSGAWCKNEAECDRVR